MSNPEKTELRITKCVWLSVKAYKSEGMKRIIFDEKLISDFYKWMLDEKIYKPVRSGSSGAGSFKGAFWPEDIDKILKWFEDRGVKDIVEIVKE